MVAENDLAQPGGLTQPDRRKRLPWGKLDFRACDSLSKIEAQPVDNFPLDPSQVRRTAEICRLRFVRLIYVNYRPATSPAFFGISRLTTPKS